MPKKVSTGNTQYFQATGRRKEAIARVRVMPGNGIITVNGKDITEVYPGAYFEKLYLRPFEVTKSMGKYASSIKVLGGGRSSQLDAIIHGLSRALSQIDLEFRTPLKRNKLLTRDPRARERRKYGLAHGARAQKQSPKR